MPPVLPVPPRPETCNPKRNSGFQDWGFVITHLEQEGKAGAWHTPACNGKSPSISVIHVTRMDSYTLFKVKLPCFLSKLTVQLQPCINSACSDENSAFNTCLQLFGFSSKRQLITLYTSFMAAFASGGHSVCKDSQNIYPMCYELTPKPVVNTN